MRKIEQNMIAAIVGRESRNVGGNTVVTVLSDPRGNTPHQIEITLYGHMIARRFSDKRWYVNLCGYNTPTTRSRLTALLGAFYRNWPNGAGVSSRGGVIRLHDARGETVIDAHNWHVVELGEHFA